MGVTPPGEHPVSVRWSPRRGPAGASPRALVRRHQVRVALVEDARCPSWAGGGHLLLRPAPEDGRTLPPGLWRSTGAEALALVRGTLNRGGGSAACEVDAHGDSHTNGEQDATQGHSGAHPVRFMWRISSGN